MPEDTIEPKNIPQVEPKESTTDMKVFFEKFRASDEYNSAFQIFLSERPKREALDQLPEEEWKALFEEISDLSRWALDDFERENPFSYEPVLYPEGLQAQIKNYFESPHRVEQASELIKFREHVTETAREKIQRLDEQRQKEHNVVAQALFDQGYAPTFQLARQLLGMILAGQDKAKRREASMSVARRTRYVISGK